MRDGVACKHPGCLSHISHPCEGCGRIGGRSQTPKPEFTEVLAACDMSVEALESGAASEVIRNPKYIAPITS